ncbi:MAG: hypothetical protein V1733_09815 [bacterium]
MRKKKRVVFRDCDIVDFCTATQDTNVIHNPGFMDGYGKRVIVPGMFAFSCAAILSEEFLKHSANRIQVYFNSLLSSGESVGLGVETNLEDPAEMRLCAVNSRDMLTARESYTRMLTGDIGITPQKEGIFRKLPVSEEQIATFARLIQTKDRQSAGFLFAVSYASQALFKSITEASTEVEHEIDRLINGDYKISPFYHALEIIIPSEFPVLIETGTLDYLIHFEREKFNKTYVAHLECQQEGRIIFQSKYKLVAIPDSVILRMAKEKTI